MIEICTLGGYKEIGKNCTAIRIDDEVVIFDMGIHLDKYIAHTEDGDELDMSPRTLMQIGAVPNLEPIKKWKDNVVAIIPSHAHLDHIGAIPYLAHKFDCDIICTPFTKEVIHAITRDKNTHLNNNIISLNPNATYKISENLTVEFVHTTHSTPHTVNVALHTPYGIIIYSNDFKLDDTPILGKPPNYKRLKQLGEKGVKLVIMDSLYAGDARKTPSENIAREMLRNVMLDMPHKKGLVITTFASHIARLKSLIEFGKKLNRKIVFLGRSLDRYTYAAERAGLMNCKKDVKIVKFRDQIKRELKRINENKEKYLIVCTGHQGEPKAVLSRIVQGREGLKLDSKDTVVFSSNIIPTPINIAAREELEGHIKDLGSKLFTGIHVSGHGSREDQRLFLELLKPEQIIPSHCEIQMAGKMAELATELGYKLEKVHIMSDGEFKIIQ